MGVARDAVGIDDWVEPLNEAMSTAPHPPEGVRLAKGQSRRNEDGGKLHTDSYI